MENSVRDLAGNKVDRPVLHLTGDELDGVVGVGQTKKLAREKLRIDAADVDQNSGHEFTVGNDTENVFSISGSNPSRTEL